MEQLDTRDRRQAYRYTPPPVMTPVFSIIHDGRRITAERVVDVNLRGARIEFEADVGASIRSGSEVTLTVQAPGLDGCADVAARVVFSASRHGRHVVALVFLEVPDVDDRCDPAFFSVFNRRSDERRDEVATVSAVLLPGDAASGGREPFELEVVNHSAGGIGFVVDEALDRLIRSREALDIAVTTPDDTAPRPRVARVLHRATRSDSVYYGCMFAA